MVVGGKKKFKKVKKWKEEVKQRIEKFEKTLKVSSNDKFLYSHLNFNFSGCVYPQR